MSVQSRRTPSKLVAATVYGFIWAALLIIASLFVWGTLAEIRTQAVEGTERLYFSWYLFSVYFPAVIALCRMGRVEASKRLYLTVQLVNFNVLLWIFRAVLDLAGGNDLAFFLGNPEPGVVSVYEAFFILVLFLCGEILQMLSVMNDKYRNKIRIGVGGILFIISIFLPKLLDSYALVRASCTSPLSKDAYIEAQCQERALETIPMFTMAIAFSAVLLVQFFFSMLSPTIERFISSRTGDGAQTQQDLPGQELETATLPSSAEPSSTVAQCHSPCGSIAAAVLGGAVVWMIQAIGERMVKHR